jgi:hypothetical protein
MMVYCFNKNIEKNFYFLNKCYATKILINTEFYTHCGVEILLKKINLYNKNNFYLFDYNRLNIINIKNIYKNINIFYFPLIYNEYLEIFYSKFIKNKLSWNEKDIDILFYGSLNKRRGYIIDKLKQKYNVVYFIDTNDHKSLCEHIERSKIVINILFYDYNIVFDYYRNTFLLSNNILLLTELSINIDFDIEYNLKDINDNINICNYDQFEESIDNLLKKNIIEIEEIKKNNIIGLKNII